MRQKGFYQAGAILLAVLLLITSLVPACFAAGGVGEVNLHMGQSPDTVYLTCTSSKKAAALVAVIGPVGTTTYPVVQSSWSDSTGKYIHKAALAGLTAARNVYPAGSGAPLCLTGGESGAVKWYNDQKYTVQRGDPLAPNDGFLEVNSTVPAHPPGERIPAGPTGRPAP